MMVMTTLDKAEHAALQMAPGHSDRQRLRWLARFWMAVCEEQEQRKEAEAKANEAAKPKLHAVDAPDNSAETAETEHDPGLEVTAQFEEHPLLARVEVAP